MKHIKLCLIQTKENSMICFEVHDQHIEILLHEHKHDELQADFEVLRICSVGSKVELSNEVVLNSIWKIYFELEVNQEEQILLDNNKHKENQRKNQYL